MYTLLQFEADFDHTLETHYLCAKDGHTLLTFCSEFHHKAKNCGKSSFTSFFSKIDWN